MAARKFRHVYEGLLQQLLSSRLVEVNERTNKAIKNLAEPVHFVLDLSSGELPMCGVRRMYPKSAAAEVAWFLQGTRDSTFIRKYAPLWDKFVEDDGVTVDAAYGYRWREHFGRDQIVGAAYALWENPTSRRVWVQAWDPAHDGLTAEGQKNVPCPIGFTLSIVDGKLNSSLFIRSSDVFVGLPYDVMGHALLMKAILHTLRRMDGPLFAALELGTMGVTLAHPHLYCLHADMASEALNSRPCDDSAPMPSWSIHEIEANPDGYVEQVAKSFELVLKPEYFCRPEVVA